MQRWGYAGTIREFLSEPVEQVFGKIATQSAFADLISQKAAWLAEIGLLREALGEWSETPGAIYFEYTIPRLGGRADVILLLGQVLFVIEFKTGAEQFARDAIDQVWDYALDLKNFHEASHHIVIVPVLVATEAVASPVTIAFQADYDHLARPVCIGDDGIAHVIAQALAFFSGETIDAASWQVGRYRPTPTIVEAARALYAGHAVEEISRSDAGAENLAVTSRRLSAIIADTRRANVKAICFVTGVPGAGKTLVGLDIANRHTDKDSELYSVYLSGNGPLVNVLHEALARDRHRNLREQGRPIRLGEARSQ